MDIKTLITSENEIVIFDTEYTTWEGALERQWSGTNEHRELVQLAAAKLNLKDKTIVDNFSVLVKPSINPILSDYFIQLTGISQKEVDNKGIDFETTYNQFMTWVGECNCFSYRDPRHAIGDAVIFVENIALYGLEIEVLHSRFHNIKPIFIAAGVPADKFNSGKLHQYFGINLDGVEHNAMHDVNSLVYSLFALY